MTPPRAPSAAPGRRGGAGLEAPREFYPTPERLSQFLERKYQEISTELVSSEGRRKLFEELLPHAEHLQELYPGFDPERLRIQLELVGEELRAKADVFRSVNGEALQVVREEVPVEGVAAAKKEGAVEAKEKEGKSFWKWAMEKISSIVSIAKHPITIAVLVTAIVGFAASHFGLLAPIVARLKELAGPYLAEAGKLIARGREMLPRGLTPPPVAPLPTDIPGGVNEAERIIKEIGRGAPPPMPPPPRPP